MSVAMNGRRSVARRGFTLIELLVVIAIMALLLGILAPALRGARDTATAASEMAGAHQQMLAFALRADEQRGQVLQGYPPAPGPEGAALALGMDGRPLGTPMSQRYPWRLLPYMEWEHRALMRSPTRIAALAEQDPAAATYVVSVAPALGMNQTFIGGSADSGTRGGVAFNRKAIETWGGSWFVDHVADAQRPSLLIVFLSATSSLTDSDGDPLDGSYRVTPPWFDIRLWAAAPARSRAEIGSIGNVSLRFGGKAVGAMFDGHAELLDWMQLNDMRRWAPQADRADWALLRP